MNISTEVTNVSTLSATSSIATTNTLLPTALAMEEELLPEGLAKTFLQAALLASIPILLIRSSVYCALQSLMTREHVVMTSICFLILLDHSFLCLSTYLQQLPLACRINSLLLHYSTLAVFFCLAVLAIDSWWRAVVYQPGKRGNGKYAKHLKRKRNCVLVWSYCSFTLVVPAAIVGLGFWWRPEWTGYCWPGPATFRMLLILAPALSMAVIALALALYSLYSVVCAGQNSENFSNNQFYQFCQILVLTGLLTVAWTSLLLASSLRMSQLYYMSAATFIVLDLYLLFALVLTRSTFAHVKRAAQLRPLPLRVQEKLRMRRQKSHLPPPMRRRSIRSQTPPPMPLHRLDRARMRRERDSDSTSRKWLLSQTTDDTGYCRASCSSNHSLVSSRISCSGRSNWNHSYSSQRPFKSKEPLLGEEYC